MTVRELISALQELIYEDDNASGIASMEVWVNQWGNSEGEFPVGHVHIDDNRVWL